MPDVLCVTIVDISKSLLFQLHTSKIMIDPSALDAGGPMSPDLRKWMDV